MVEKHLRQPKDSYLDLLILFFFPLVQVFINSNWIFNPIRAVPSLPFQDTWFYNGNFFYFFDYANEGATGIHYFVERLPSNIPGYYLYHLLSPLKANYILHLGYYYMAVFSLYSILRSLLNQRSALIASLAMGSYPWFLRAVGWDYVDGVGIAYYCLSMALMVAASRRQQWRLLLFAAGIASACLVFTNLFWVPFILMLVLFYIVLNHLFEKRSLIYSGLFFGAGGVAMTALFSVFYYFAAGRFLFFANSIRAARDISGDSTLTPLLELIYGPMEPYWLILPVLCLITMCLWLTSRKLSINNKTHVIQILLLIHFCLFFGLFTFWHIFFQPYLSIFLYMSYVIPATFLLFGILISDRLNDFTDRQFYVLVAASVAIFIAPMLLTLSSRIFKVFAGIQDDWILMVASGSMLTGFLLLSRRSSVLFACAAITAINFIGGADANVYVQDRWKGRDGFIAVVEAVKAIDKIYPDNDQKLVFMYDFYNFDIPGFAIGGIYVDMRGRLIDYNESNPIGWDDIAPFNDRDVLLIARKGNAYKKLKEQFSQYSESIRLDLKARTPIQSGKIKFYLFLFHINYPEHDHLYPGETFEFDLPFKGKNFYPIEIDQDLSYVWSGPGTESEMYLRLGSLQRDVDLSICAHALEPEILDSFQLYVNNIYIPTIVRSEAGCSSVLTGTIPKTIINKAPLDVTTFTFRVSQTISPADLGINVDARKLGLNLDWIKIE